ncbi:hypothetical protein M9Y10_031266 [Tritrichomonas musculus]|uniref:Uncharacterized protein n=1 Tax=Tritrichomonas musculus TaxID=1915356 RepID=A0ABR2H1G2_9EUKA
MKLIKSQQHHLLQFEPENQEIYDYLNKHHHSFKSKHKDFLIINIPYDFDKAVEKLSYYDKYSSSKTVERNDISKNKPITIYYFNEISSLQDIYDKLQEVFLAELKPFKIHFQLSGIFETYNLDLETREETYTYEAREIRWKNYQSSIPIIIKNTEDINLVKLYIESTLSSYETTSSNNKLTIVSSISFTVSRMIKITGKIEGLPEEIIKSKSVIADNIDDKLCWYRFLSICLNPDLMKALVKRRTQIAKQLLLQKYGISYSNNMKNEDRIKAQNILDNYQGTNYYEMKEEAKQYNLNINIYGYDEKIKQYDIKKIWKNNENDIYHSALLFTFKSIIHIMYIKPK